MLRRNTQMKKLRTGAPWRTHWQIRLL